MLTIMMLFNSFLSIGQTKQVEVEGIFEPGWGYRGYSISDIESDIKFTGLFAENNVFYLKPIEVGFAEDIVECTGDSALIFIIDEDNCLFLFPHFTGYNEAPIEAINQGERIGMSPNTQFNFTYNQINYTLQADGEMENSNIENYTLTFFRTDCRTKQIIVELDYIQSTEVEILFIGDLDGDGEPDIILNAPNNYENRDIMLFLSSSKQEKELLHLEAEKFDWFDC